MIKPGDIIKTPENQSITVISVNVPSKDVVVAYYNDNNEICVLGFDNAVEEEVDWKNIPIDTKVFVRDSTTCTWNPRYFAKYDSATNTVYTFSDGSTSWSSYNGAVTYWKYAKLAD